MTYPYAKKHLENARLFEPLVLVDTKKW